MAASDDLEAVERLLMQTFSRHGRSVMKNVPPELQLRVRLALRRSMAEPAAGLVVATDGADLAGVVAIETAETATLPTLATLRALRPLGAVGMARFLLVTLVACHRPASHEAYLLGMAVAPSYRRQGVAERLMQAAEGQARQRGKRLATLFIACDNHPSLALARKGGFRPAQARAVPWRRLLSSEPVFLRLDKVLNPL